MTVRQVPSGRWQARLRDGRGNWQHLGLHDTEEAANEACEEFAELRDYIDPVAVERALRGERAVWDALTRLEREHVENEAYRRLREEIDYVRDWHRTFRQLGIKEEGSSGLARPQRDWFHPWCASIGEDPNLLRKRAHRRLVRAVPAAA